MLNNVRNTDLRKIQELFLLGVDHKKCVLSVKAAKAQIKNLTARLVADGTLADDSLVTHFDDMVSDEAIEKLARIKSARSVINAADHTGMRLAGSGEVLEIYLI